MHQLKTGLLRLCRLGGSCWMVALTVAFLPVVTAAQTPTDTASTTPASAEASTESLFADFLHYARMGRFTAADAFAKQLLAHPDLDPTEILEFAQRDRDSVDTLLILIKNSSIGDSAEQVLDLIHEGENQKRKSADRIRANIENLGRGPQQEFFGQRALAESGEYAVPYLVEALGDEEMAELRPRIATALTRMGRSAVTPMSIALQVRDEDVRLNLIRGLGEIGYAHALPYLLKYAEDADVGSQTRSAARDAVAQIEARQGRPVSGRAADLFVQLAERYYRGDDAVSADPSMATANVWYWNTDNQALSAVQVPERIFGTVMAMRCCGEALLLQPDRADAIALWLAANTRRESRLGMNVESGDPNETGDADATRPSVFPRALYFSQAAGPRYAHLMLARAVRDNDSAVALGAIEALRVTAGESSLIGTEDYKQPLVQALQFPDLLVRVRAALALGAALPKSPFAGDQYVVPQLAAAVSLTGEDHVVVVDADQANLNRVMAALRSEGLKVIGDSSFYRALEQARDKVQSLRGLFLASDLSDPPLETALQQMRGEYLFSQMPVVILTKPSHALAAETMADSDTNVESVDADSDDTDLVDAFTRLRERTGQSDPGRDSAVTIALEAVETLRNIAADGRTVFRAGEAEQALLAALRSEEESLQTAAAAALAYLGTPSAQSGIAAMALDDAHATDLRVSALTSLASSAKRNGSLLNEGQITALVELARDESNLTLRTAASQALGALNLASNKASEIIRSYHGD